MKKPNYTKEPLNYVMMTMNVSELLNNMVNFKIVQYLNQLNGIKNIWRNVEDSAQNIIKVINKSVLMHYSTSNNKC